MISNPNKKEIVYNRIRRAIISGDLLSGEIMNEAEIAARFESGKTPTREALLLLTHERFLESLPRVGYRVTKPTLQDIQEIFYLRIILEVEAIGFAVGNLTTEVVELLEKNNLEENRLTGSLSDGKGERAASLNREFHLIIAEQTGNERMIRIIKNLIDDMERMLVSDPYIADPNQHRVIIESMISGDNTSAQSAMQQHIKDTRQRILNRY
jgi:DNA-binding GntR family transcriptional regulator